MEVLREARAGGFDRAETGDCCAAFFPHDDGARRRGANAKDPPDTRARWELLDGSAAGWTVELLPSGRAEVPISV